MNKNGKGLGAYLFWIFIGIIAGIFIAKKFFCKC